MDNSKSRRHQRPSNAKQVVRSKKPQQGHSEMGNCKMPFDVFNSTDDEKESKEQQENSQQQQGVPTTSSRTTTDPLEERAGVTQKGEECWEAVGEPTSPEVTSWGKGQFGPIVPLYTPPAASETSPGVGASPLTPGQRRMEPHVEVRPLAEQQSMLKLSSKEWPTLGESHVKSRRHSQDESKSPPQQQQSPTPLPITVLPDNKDQTIPCVQADSPPQSEHHREVNINTVNQEIIHNVKLPMENEDTARACAQKADPKEEDLEKGNVQSVACSIASTLCPDAIAFSPQANTCVQAINDKESSEASSPTSTLIGESQIEPGSSSESGVTVLDSDSKLPQIALTPGFTFSPKKSVVDPEHWGTNMVPDTMKVRTEACKDNSGHLPSNFPLQYFEHCNPSGITEGQFFPTIADERIIQESPLYNNYPNVHNDRGMYSTSPLYYGPPPQLSQMNYHPMQYNRQNPTAQRWEQMMEPQQDFAHQDISGLQQQNIMQGQGVFMNHVPVPPQQAHMTRHFVYFPVPTTGHLSLSQPVTQHAHMTRQRAFFEVPTTSHVPMPLHYNPVTQQPHQRPQNYQVPHIPQLWYMRQYPPPLTNYEVQNPQQVMPMQQYLHVIRQQQQQHTTQYEQGPSQEFLTSHQHQPVSHHQQLQMQSEVPISNSVTDALQQLSVIQSQQGSVSHEPPVSQYLPVTQQNFAIQNKDKTTPYQELAARPLQHQMSGAEQNVLPKPEVSPKPEEKPAGAEETRGLERPPHLHMPWVSEVESAMIHTPVPVVPANPNVSAALAVLAALPVKPDFRRPPPPIDYLTSTPGVTQASKTPRQNNANDTQWPEQYQVPPRMLNNHQGRQQWTNPPPVGIPTHRGRGVSYSQNTRGGGRTNKGRGARLPSRNDGENGPRVSGLQSQPSNTNGHGQASEPVSHINRSDAVPSNECTPKPCQEKRNTNSGNLGQNQLHSGDRNNNREHSNAVQQDYRQQRGAYRGRNARMHINHR